MKKITLEALIKSRNKWKRIYGSTKAEDRAVDNCALCKLFEDCEDGCPVHIKTGEDCGGSPYDAWWYHHADCHNNRHKIKSRKPYCGTCKQLAFDELKFLDDLLPVKYRMLKKGAKK